MLIINNSIAFNNVLGMMLVLSVAGETVSGINVVKEKAFRRKKSVCEAIPSSGFSVKKL